MQTDQPKPTGEPFSVCECGHATIDHRKCNDHDECTIGECECDRIRPIHKPTGEQQRDELDRQVEIANFGNCDGSISKQFHAEVIRLEMGGDLVTAFQDPKCEAEPQPKPTGEWTVEHEAETVRLLFGDGSCESFPVVVAPSIRVIAKRHNAELDAVIAAAVKAENKRMMEFWQGEREIIQRKLAAEEKRANDSIEENVRLLNRLAAEREISKEWFDKWGDEKAKGKS